MSAVGDIAFIWFLAICAICLFTGAAGRRKTPPPPRPPREVVERTGRPFRVRGARLVPQAPAPAPRACQRRRRLYITTRDHG